MNEIDADVQGAAAVDAVVSFDLHAAAAYFERIGQACGQPTPFVSVQRICSGGCRGPPKLDEVLPHLGDAARFPQPRTK